MRLTVRSFDLRCLQSASKLRVQLDLKSSDMSIEEIFGSGLHLGEPPNYIKTL